ncbi:hypothetical protein QE152_g22128 [Popillia japonica]|uniref:Protein phosphatase 1 regulatory subunit 35 C-terminal domain-containing protein n=1 Tax=Popillia japonica TaxID=7064 RepID=A0AAW1KLB7_POPJA
MEVIVTSPKFNSNSPNASKNSKLHKRLLDLFGESPEAPKTCDNITKRHIELFGPSPKPAIISRNVTSNYSGHPRRGKQNLKQQLSNRTFGDTPTKLKLKKVHPEEDENVSLEPASQYETPPKTKPNGLPITPGLEFKIPAIPNLPKTKSTRQERDEIFLEEIFKEMCICEMPKLLSPLKKTPEKVAKSTKINECNLHRKPKKLDKELDNVFKDRSIFDVPKLLSPLQQSPQPEKNREKPTEAYQSPQPEKNREKPTEAYVLSLPEDATIFRVGKSQKVNDEIEDLYEQFCFMTQFDFSCWQIAESQR